MFCFLHTSTECYHSQSVSRYFSCRRKQIWLPTRTHRRRGTQCFPDTNPSIYVYTDLHRSTSLTIKLTSPDFPDWPVHRWRSYFKVSMRVKPIIKHIAKLKYYMFFVQRKAVCLFSVYPDIRS